MSGKNPRPIVVVTGGTAGVGRATAVEFARQGADIAILARGRERLQSTCEEVESLGCRALGLSVDVADAGAIEAAAERIETELGPIDVWVNNAFVGIFASFMDMKEEEYRRVTDVTYFGQVHGTRAALKRMIPRDRGRVVLVGSALAYRGIPLQSAYCGAKHAVQGFLDSVRSELLHRGSRVRICMVQLPALNTPQFDWARTRFDRKPRPVGKIYQPEVAARAICYAARSRRKEVWVGSTTLQAIIGDRLASSWLDRYLARFGVSGQASQEPLGSDWQDNLFGPAAGDPGAHGRFDARAYSFSIQMLLNRHRAALAVGSGVVGAALGLGLLAKRRTRARGV